MASRFETTSWQLVLAARDGPTSESRQALARLCEAYWYPLYAFVRQQGFDAEEARDLTQGYFTSLLDKSYLQDVEPTSGRFRSFLLASLKHFLSKEREKASAVKRGGRVRVISLDVDGAEDRYAVEPVDRLDPEAVFERRWALTVLERAMRRLEKEFVECGKQQRFERLHGYLTSAEPRAPYRQVAAELEMSEGAVREAVRRMRQRFGHLLREEIAETVADPADLDVEVRHLLSVSGLAGGPAA